jgi:hypothetical protein
MAFFRRWTWLRTFVLAVCLGVAIVGMCQFALTDVRPLGSCAGIQSPARTVVDWLEMGRPEPLLAYFGYHAKVRFLWTSLAIILLAGMLAWSLYTQRPIRGRLRLRTLMIAVAILPISWVGAGKVWVMWHRWEQAWRMVDYFTLLEDDSAYMADSMASGDPADEAEVAQFRKTLSDEYQAGRRRYLYLLWHPWWDDQTDPVQHP